MGTLTTVTQRQWLTSCDNTNLHNHFPDAECGSIVNPLLIQLVVVDAPDSRLYPYQEGFPFGFFLLDHSLQAPSYSVETQIRRFGNIPYSGPSIRDLILLQG